MPLTTRRAHKTAALNESRAHFFHQNQSQNQTILLENLGAVSRLKDLPAKGRKGEMLI